MIFTHTGDNTLHRNDDAANLALLLNHLQFFPGIESEDLALVAQHVHLRRYAKGARIFGPADTASGLYLLFSGRVKVTRVNATDGKELILYLVRPGEILGLLRYLLPSYVNKSAVTIEPSQIGFLHRDNCDRLMARLPLAASFNEALALRARRGEDRLFEISFRSVPERIAHLLLRLADEHAHARECGVQIDVRLTQQEIAGVIAATREMTSLTLNEFRRSGWIEMHNHFICIHQRAPLEELAT